MFCVLFCVVVVVVVFFNMFTHVLGTVHIYSVSRHLMAFGHSSKVHALFNFPTSGTYVLQETSQHFSHTKTS